MDFRLVLCGFGIWTGATVALRLAGQYVLRPASSASTLILFAVSFPVTAVLVRALCRRFGLRPEEWPAGAVALLLPTLLLDPFSSAYFPLVFPNMPPEVAGTFGGWMLCCCAGALVGATIRRPGRA